MNNTRNKSNKKFFMPSQSKLMSQVARVKRPNKLAIYVAVGCAMAIAAAFAFSGASNAVVQDDDNAITSKIKPKLDLSINEDDLRPKNLGLATKDIPASSIESNTSNSNASKSKSDDEVKRILAQEAAERASLDGGDSNTQNIQNSNLEQQKIARYSANPNVAVNPSSINNQQANNQAGIPQMPAMPNIQELQAGAMAGMPDMAALAGGMSGMNGGSNDANMQAKKEKFATKSGNFGYLESVKQNALSDYELKAGSVIPAILTNALNSDLPGMVTAIVSQDVYDSITHSHVLIQKGTKLNGIYDSNLSFGQNGLAVVWNRLVFADGSVFDIGSMTGGDQAGNSGFRDKVNNHYGRTFGSAFLVALIGSGMQLSQPKSKGTAANDAQETITGNVAQQTGNTAQGVLGKMINVQPTVTVNAGYRFNVMVNKDLVIGGEG
jgi:type IV secretion system protein TrbI